MTTRETDLRELHPDVVADEARSVVSQTGAGDGVGAGIAGVDGSGVTIGIISDSFNLTAPVTATAPGGDTMAFDIANGELPGATTILEDGTPGQGEMDEGRAIGQLIHDIAPGASLLFHDAGDDQQHMAQAILALAQAGAKVIVDDVGFPDEPAYQDGIIATTIDEVVQEYGVTYVSAAGNANGEGWQGLANFSPSSTTLHYASGQAFLDPNTHSSSGVHLEQFGGAAEPYLSLTASYTSEYIKDGIPTDVEVTLEWNQPETGGVSTGPTSQVELLLQDATTGALLPAEDQGTTSISQSGEAAQVIDFQPVSGHAYRLLAADVNTGQVAPPTDLKVIVYSDDYVVLGDGATAATAETTATEYGHPAALDAISVGAAYYLDTPDYGTSPPVVEDFSSAGPDVQDFAADGSRLATPFAAHGPDITAADGGDTTFFPEYPDSDTDGDGLPNFFGTSAASGDIAAVAALLLEADPRLSWSQVESVMQATATPMAHPAQTGAGLVQASAAVALAQTLDASPDTPVFGSSTGGTVTADGPREVLVGGAGDDTLVGAGGSELFLGQGGDDTVVYGDVSFDHGVLHLSNGSGTISTNGQGGDDLSSVETIQFLDGALTGDLDGPAAQVYRLYDAAFGRVPEFSALSAWADQLAHGLTLQHMADLFSTGAEWQARYGDLTDTAFVTQVYEDALHRAPDPDGLAAWTGDLEDGSVSRPQLVALFSEGDEHRALTAAGIQAHGLWVADPIYDDVEYVYRAAFGRLADSGGLEHWAGEIEAGRLDFHALVVTATESPEFAAHTAGLDNSHLVDFLYRTALDRPADPSGHDYWTAHLNAGESVADLVLQFAQSAELQGLVQPQLDHADWFAG